MTKRLLIDLNKCDACEKCTVQCSAFYRARATDHGLITLRELAQFTIVCRRCEEPSCVAACKFKALERQADGILKRYNLRCVSCKCCSQACPFGTIYPDTVPFYATVCDFCTAAAGREPPCIISCPNQAVSFQEIEPSPKDGIHLVNDRVAVKAPRWDKKDV